ncbi:hypothetical protein MN608_08428 [Microdochium nivale]|nr:hypothetical protein MN608_08428 [Microdochium nivale]
MAQDILMAITAIYHRLIDLEQPATDDSDSDSDTDTDTDSNSDSTSDSDVSTVDGAISDVSADGDQDAIGYNIFERLPKRDAEPVTLETLPTEIIGHIMYFCGHVSLACLNLTSRRLHAVAWHFRLPRHLSIKDSQALSRLLEGSAPGYSHCINRRKLVAFSAQCINKPLLSYHACSPSLGPVAVLPALFAVSNRFRLPWCTAHLVTNRHFHGPSHGLPVSVLSHARRTIDFGTIHLRQAWDARLSPQGELLLRCVRTWCDTGILLITMRHGRVVFCAHMAADMRRDHFGCNRYNIRIVEHQSYRLCQKCGTECEIRTGPGTGDVVMEGWPQNTAKPSRVVVVTTWFNLGTCRSADDEKWTAFSRGSVLQRRVVPGSVRGVWDSLC